MNASLDARASTWLHCNRYNTQTQHVLEKKYERDWSEDFENDNGHKYWISSHENYETWRCCGCNSVSFRHTGWFSEDTDESGKPIQREKIYPPRLSRSRPRWLSSIIGAPFWTGETLIEKLLGEIYTSLDNDCPRPAAMGMRSLMECIFDEKVGHEGGFPAKLERMKQVGLLSNSQVETTKAIVELGHSAVHRAHNPSLSHLMASMDAIEALVPSIYIHPDSMANMKSVLPPDKRKRV